MAVPRNATPADLERLRKQAMARYEASAGPRKPKHLPPNYVEVSRQPIVATSAETAAAAAEIDSEPEASMASSSSSSEDEAATGSMDADDDEDDPDRAWCFCQRPSEGMMIGCDNPKCKISWFHFDCLGLKEAPQGVWFCPTCAPCFRRCK